MYRADTAFHTMLRMTRVVPLSLGLLLGGSALAQTPEAEGEAIARKTDASDNGYGAETAQLEMVLVDAHGRTTSRRMSYTGAEMADDGDRSRIEFSSPADVQGTRLLTWTHKVAADDQWLYLPAVGAVKRISGGGKSGSFVGSEFAYEDLASTEVEKYSYKFVEESMFEGRKVWKYERIPVDPKSGYSRQVVSTDQEYLQPLHIDYFDRKGELLKTMDFKGYVRHGSWWRWTEIHVMNTQTQKGSKLLASDRVMGATVASDFFASDTLDE